MTTRTYDSRCYDLASLFLEDEPTIFSDANARQLALLIQETIEDFIEYKRENYDGPTAA